MPQEICVVKCFDCKMYQTDIVKKAKKWQCKLCGVKQTLRTEFFRGGGADCRLKVQQLNMQHGTESQEDANQALQLLFDDNINRNEVNAEVQNSLATQPMSSEKKNKWSDYLKDKSISSKENALQARANYQQEALKSVAKHKGSLKRKLESDKPRTINTKSSKWHAFF